MELFVLNVIIFVKELYLVDIWKIFELIKKLYYSIEIILF